jgi:energy-coupling factor transporter ATP-binding protein EcfA2
MPERHSVNPIMRISSLGQDRTPLPVLEYWRNSLADAERQAVDGKKLRAALAIPTQMLRRGQITDRALLDALFRAHAEALGEPAGTSRLHATAQPARSSAETDQEESCPVLLCVVRASPRTERSKRKQAAIHYIAPLWIPAILSRSGRLTQPESAAPWLSRDLLEPIRRGGNEMVLGSTESLDEFLSNHEVPEAGEGWTAYWVYGNAMLSYVARDAGWSYADVSVDDAAKNETVGRGFDLVAAGLDPQRLYQTDRGSFVLADTRIQGASRYILKLYDHLRTRKSVPPLLDRYSHIDHWPQRPTLSSAEQQANAARHLGQMSDEFELAPSQRQAFHHCLAIGAGEILAINGPPGTGKTTLLQSLVATLFVERALDGKEPPIVVVASTNNQAVTNVIESFGRIKIVNRLHDPFLERLVGRWLPDDALTSYALYCPSKIQMDKGQPRGFLMTDLKGEGFPNRIQDREYVTKAHASFLGRTIGALGREVRTVDEAVELLHHRLRERYERLRAGPEKRSALEHERLCCTQAKQALHAADCALRATEENRARVETVAREAEIRAEAIGAEILSIRQVQASWVKETERRPWWVSLCASWLAQARRPWWVSLCASWLAPARRRVLLDNEVFFGQAALQPDGINLADDEAIAEWFREQLKRREDTRRGLQWQAEQMRSAAGMEFTRAHTAAAMARERVREAEVALQHAADAWHVWAVALGVDPHSNAPFDALNTTLRCELFLLATHYWEGRWLLEMASAYESGFGGTPERQSLEGQQRRWRRYTKLTPCFVSTCYMAPRFFAYWEGPRSGGTELPLEEFIDWLIVDEAGQVTPEVGGATFALAQRALVFGDTMQIQPVWGVHRVTDEGNLAQSGIARTEHEREVFARTGMSAASGSVMRIAQRQSPYVVPGAEDGGMFLSEHRRCVPEIIGYCNDLAYHGRLEPKRPSEPGYPLPRMGYAHVQGRSQRVGGSRRNPTEAEMIAGWIAERREFLEALPHASKDHPKPLLKDIVAVVTPFSAQARLIRQQLAKHGIRDVTVGTVHALQGAERDVVLFSSVYTRDDRGSEFFFDRDKTMLNVTVSRARDSFIVFGDMAIFDLDVPERPSGLLARYLFADEANEIVDVRPPRQRLSLHPQSPREVAGLEAHQAELRGCLERAEHAVRITSPFVSADAITADGVDVQIRQAVKRGVVVTCYIDARLNCDAHGVERPAAARGKELLQAAGATVRIARNIHNKTLCVDDWLISEGSFNWLSAQRRDRGAYRRYERSLVYESLSLQPRINQFVDEMERRVIQPAL